jgi:hypothetical protein
MCSKKGPRRRNSAVFLCSCGLSLLIFAVFLAGADAFPADKLKELQDHFDHDTHAGSKVKDLQKLATAQFEAATTAGSAGDYVAVGFIFEKYRDNVRAAFELLKKQEPDADRHPNSFRQLELEVRQGIREVEDTLLVSPDVFRPPLELVHKDLIAVDDSLINLLFPRRTKDPVKAPLPAEGKP